MRRPCSNVHGDQAHVDAYLKPANGEPACSALPRMSRSLSVSATYVAACGVVVDVGGVM